MKHALCGIFYVLVFGQDIKPVQNVSFHVRKLIKLICFVLSLGLIVKCVLSERWRIVDCLFCTAMCSLKLYVFI